MLLASDLFALVSGCRNTGNFTCHWCGAPCTDMLPHDDLPYLPFVRSGIPAKFPGNSFTCLGCWNWQRKRVTVNYLGGGQKDGQTACKYSWLITEANAWAILPQHFPDLLKFLMSPTGSFALCLLDGPNPPDNRIQLALANDLSVIDADTPIHFTVNNVPYRYTIYEMEDALQYNGTGKESGVRYLLNLHRPVLHTNGEKKKPKGRPTIAEKEDDGRGAKRIVFRSGGQEAWAMKETKEQ